MESSSSEFTFFNSFVDNDLRNPLCRAIAAKEMNNVFTQAFSTETIADCKAVLQAFVRGNATKTLFTYQKCFEKGRLDTPRSGVIVQFLFEECDLQTHLTTTAEGLDGHCEMLQRMKEGNSNAARAVAILYLQQEAI
jgi:hypothetical protein